VKNSPLSALVLFGIAGLVGGVTWIAVGNDRIESEPARLQQTTAHAPTVVPVTPREKKLAKLLEHSKAQLERYREEGTVLPNGEIKVMDASGTPMWVHPELIEGVGRFGEPLYAMATYKKRPAVPLIAEAKHPSSEAANAKLRTLPKGKSALSLGKKPASIHDTSPAGGGKGKKNKTPNKPGAAKPDNPSDPKDG